METFLHQAVKKGGIAAFQSIGLALVSIPLLSTYALAFQVDGDAHGTDSVGYSISSHPVLDFRRESLRRFDIALNTVSEKAHVLIVCEGTPLHTSLSDTEISASFPAGSLESGLTSDEIVIRIAKAYDYDASKLDEKTFALSKRYTDPNDLPCITCDELRQSLRSILTLLDPYAPVSTPGDFNSQTNFYNSMTPEFQKRAENGVALSELNPEQRQLALAALDSVFFEPQIASVRSMAVFLEGLKRPTSEFCWVNANGPNKVDIRVFGYQGSFGTGQYRSARPLGSPFKSSGPSGYKLFTLGKDAVPLLSDTSAISVPSDLQSKADTGKYPVDPTVPSELDRALAAEGMLANRLSSTMTLREAARRAETLLADGDKLGSIHADAVDPVADKPINLFGLRYAGDARHLMATLAHVYGLRLIVGNPQQFLIALPRPRPKENARQMPEDVPADIARVTPLPLLRALATQTDFIDTMLAKEQESVVDVKQSRTSDATRNIAVNIQEQQRRRLAVSAASDVFYFPAVRRLIALAEPAVPTPASPPIPVRTLSPEADRLIALTALSGACLSQILELQKYVPPPYIVNPNNLVIKMVKDKTGTAPILSCQFLTRQVDGTLIGLGTTWDSFGWRRPDSDGHTTLKVHYGIRWTGRFLRGNVADGQLRLVYLFKMQMKAVRPCKCTVLFTFAATSLLLQNGVRGQSPAHTNPVAIGSFNGNLPQRLLLDRGVASRFDSAFADIAERGHVLIVTEGTPLHQTLTAAELREQFGDPSSEVEQPLQDTIAKLAAAYDYDSEMVDARTFILRKRYSNPEDLPCVTYSEVLLGLRAVLQVINPYSPAATPGDSLAAQRLYDALSPDQQTHALSGLTLSHLNPDQREIACEALEHSVLESRVASLRRAVALLTTAKLNGTTFRWVIVPRQDGTPVSAFAYQGRFRKANEVQVRPLTAPFKCNADSYTWFTILPTDAKGHSIPRPLQFVEVGGKKQPFWDLTATFAEDPTLPTEQDKLLAPDGMLSFRSPHTRTLLEAASHLQLSPSAHFVQQEATVEGAVADKVVNVFGQQYQGDAHHYLTALCDVYGLQLLVGENQRYTTSIPRARSTHSPAAVPAEIRRVTPLSLIRAMMGQTEYRIRTMREQKNHNTALVQLGVTDDDRTLDGKATFDAENAYYFPAVRRLIALAEPAVPTVTSPPVPVNVVGAEALRLIALTAASGNCMTQLRYLQHYVPPECLVHPENLWIQMTQVQSGGMSTLKSGFGTRRADGSFKF